MNEYRVDERPDGGCVLWVQGELDLATVDPFRDRALACLERADSLDLDLQGVSFIDSSGLAGLVLIRKQAALSGKSLWLANVGPTTLRLLEITGLRDSFDIRPGQA